MDRIRAIGQWFNDQYAAMSPRDRTLLAALITIVVIVVTGGVTIAVRGMVDDARSRVEAAANNLDDVREMVGEYRLVRSRLDAAEARMGAFDPNQMNTYLSRWLTQAGMPTSALKIDPSTVATVGSFRERTYKVTVDDAQLEGLARFLLSLETSQYPIKVRTAYFRVQERRGERSIDLNLEVVAYDKEST